MTVNEPKTSNLAAVFALLDGVKRPEVNTAANQMKALYAVRIAGLLDARDARIAELETRIAELEEEAELAESGWDAAYREGRL